MNTIQLPIRNFEAQESIFACKTRFVIVAKGRRFGYTKGAANHTMRRGLAGQFKKGLWVDTVNGNIDRYIERYFLPALNLLPAHAWSWRKQQKILTIANAYVDFRSADTPENLEGFGYDYIVLNEAGIILKDPYLWYNAIKPMMWDQECQVFIGGAPKGKGVFEELFLRGLDANQPEYTSFRFSSFANPYVRVKDIEEDIRTMPDRVVKQEVYAEFLDDTGVVFRGIKDIAILQPEDPQMDHSYVIGADVAKLQDWTVLTVYDRKTNYQVAQMRFNKLDWPYQKQKIAELSKHYNDALVTIDSTGVGEPIYEDLARSGVPIKPYHFTNETKKQLIEKMATWIELKHCRMLKLEETINEITAFTYDISEKTGRIMYNAPVGFHDDIVISHALALWELQPVIQKKLSTEESVIAQDFKQKVVLFQNQQQGIEDYTEYEAL